jgi:hypothetical protein
MGFLHRFIEILWIFKLLLGTMYMDLRNLGVVLGTIGLARMLEIVVLVKRNVVNTMVAALSLSWRNW